MADEFNLVEKSRIMDSAAMKRALRRLASEIVEKNNGAEDLYLVGIRRRGVPLAERIRDKIEKLEGRAAALRHSRHHALSRRPLDRRSKPDRQPHRARRRHRGQEHHSRRRRALYRPNDPCRDGPVDGFRPPKKVQLAVLIDRGREHRELPIQADFIGKIVPTKQTEIIKVMLKEFDEVEAVGIFERPQE